MPPPDAAVQIRSADAADAARIAALHAQSWQATYRGSLSDAYLDGAIVDERRAFWAERMAHPPAGLITLLAASDEDQSLGFVCALVDQDPVWGTLIDNLHVAPALKRNGLGRRLMGALGAHLAGLGATGSIHLFVMQANHNAIGFYGRIGGETVEQMMKTEHDGSAVPVNRIAWPSLAAFRSRVA